MTARFVLNPRGMARLLDDPGVKADLLARAQRIARAASAGADGDQGDFDAALSTQRGQRPRAVAVATDPYANRRQAKHNVLGTAVDAGRGNA